MKFVKVTITALLSATVLSACQGQNPFKRESNPVRNYPRVSDSIENRKGLVPYDRNPEPPAPPPDNTQAICSSPFSVSINGTSGARTLRFSEDTSTSYEVTLTNKLGDSFEAKAGEGMPEKSFRLLKKLSNNSAVYQITWKPARFNPGQYVQILNSKIELTSPALVSNCSGGVAWIYLDLIAEKLGTRPSISVTGLPQTPVVFGPNGNADFSIEVDDSASNGVAPVLNPIEFKREAVSGEKTVIDAVSSVDCQTVPTPVANTKKWKFACKFTSSALAEANVKSLLNSNRTGTAVVFVSAKSRANEVSSSSHQINIKVKFEKVTAQPAPAAQPGAPK